MNSFGGISMIWMLVCLRYRLIWAQIRSSKAKETTYFAACLIGVTMFAFLSLGGIGAVFAGVASGHGEDIARWALTGIFVNSAFVSLVLAAGTRPVFSDVSLRRYPLTRFGRLAVRRLMGILDPIWPISLAAALGMAVGFACLDSGLLAARLLTAAFYVVLCYLACAVMLSLLDRMLRTGKRITLLGVVWFLLCTSIGIALPSMVGMENSRWLRTADEAVSLLPPGAAASLLAGTSFPDAVLSAVILIAWGILLAAAMFVTERPPRPGERPVRSTGALRDSYDSLERLFGERLRPLAGKVLRYQFRCNRARYDLVISAPAVVLMTFLLGRTSGPAGIFRVGLVLLFVLGLYACTSVLNQFGYDGDGIRRYLLFPVSLWEVLEGGNTVLLITAGSAALLGFLVVAFVTGAFLEPQMLLMLLSSAVSGLFFFGALGFWTTVLSPRRLDFDAIRGTLSPGGYVVVAGGTVLSLAVGFIWTADSRPGPAVSLWWIGPVFVAGCLVFYLLSRRYVRKLLHSNCRRIVDVVSG